MLSKEVCARCNGAEPSRIMGGWYCLFGKTIPTYELSDCPWVTHRSNPIIDCPYKFEHAVATTMKKGRINKQSQ